MSVCGSLCEFFLGEKRRWGTYGAVVRVTAETPLRVDTLHHGRSRGDGQVVVVGEGGRDGGRLGTEERQRGRASVVINAQL